MVYARLLSNRQVVGFARATSDRALNGTIWDVVTDPALPDEVCSCKIEPTRRGVFFIPSQNRYYFSLANYDHRCNCPVTAPPIYQPLVKRNVVKYLLKELRRTVPGCSIALFSSEKDKTFFEGLDFVADPDGIKGMALFEDSKPGYL